MTVYHRRNIFGHSKYSPKMCGLTVTRILLPHMKMVEVKIVDYFPDIVAQLASAVILRGISNGSFINEHQ